MKKIIPVLIAFFCLIISSCVKPSHDEWGISRGEIRLVPSEHMILVPGVGVKNIVELGMSRSEVRKANIGLAYRESKEGNAGGYPGVGIDFEFSKEGVVNMIGISLTNDVRNFYNLHFRGKLLHEGHYFSENDLNGLSREKIISLFGILDESNPSSFWRNVDSLFSPPLLEGCEGLVYRSKGIQFNMWKGRLEHIVIRRARGSEYQFKKE